MRIIVCLIIMMSYQVCLGQTISIQTGMSSDIYFASKSNNQYNARPEIYSDLLGINLSYTFKLDSIKQNEMILFMDLYRFNYGISIKSYPETKKMEQRKETMPTALSPSLGLLYSLPIIQKHKFSINIMFGGSVRFHLFGMSAYAKSDYAGTSGVEYQINQDLDQKKIMSFALNAAGQFRYRLNKGTNLLLTPLISVGTFNWYKKRYLYQFSENDKIIESGSNTMNNNGSRIQLLIGFEFSF